MKRLLRFLVGLTFKLAFASFLSLTIFKYQLLDPSFLIESFRQAGIYKPAEIELQKSIRETLEKEIEKQELNTYLTSAQKKLFDEKIDETANAITENRIQDVIETNTERFLAYFKSESDNLYLYFPIDEWGIPEEFAGQYPLNQFSEDTDLYSITDDKNAIDTFFEQSAKVRDSTSYVQPAWVIVIVLLISLLLFHYLLSSKNIKSTAKLLITTSGFSTLSGLLIRFLASKNTLSQIHTSNQVYTTFVVPILRNILLDISRLWLTISVSVLLMGLVILISNYMFIKSRKSPESP